MKLTHIHHIVPKHAGGSNNPSNLVELTIQEHAEAHRKLYEKHGHKQDKLAWLMLSGKTDEGEAVRIELAKEGFKLFLEDEESVVAWKRDISKSLKGRTLSEEHKANISNGLKKAYSEGMKEYSKPDINVLRSNYYKNKHNLDEGRMRSKAWHDAFKQPEYKELKRQQMLGRKNTWGKKVSTAKRGKATKSTISICINGITYTSIANAARELDIPAYKLRHLHAKHGEFISI